MYVDHRKMTTYGTIHTESTSSPISSNLPLLLRAKQLIRSTFGTGRPWTEMFQVHAFTLPLSSFDIIERIKINATHFHLNYATIALCILFVSMLWHPVSLIVFVIMMGAWSFMYFLRDGPLVAFGYVVDDCLVMTALSLATIAVFFLTDVTRNIVVGLCIGMVVILVHGALTLPDDSMSEDYEQGIGSTAPLNGERVKHIPLKNAPSSSFNSS